MQALEIGLSAWIIQDGNYGEFEVGRDYRFALEFFSRDLVVDDKPVGAKRLTPVGNAMYRAVGEVMFASDEAWVIDVGVPAYRDEPSPHNARVGSQVMGDIYIGIDPFFYFERLASLPGMPDIYRHWHINRILLDTTPWRESVDEIGHKFLTRDESKTSFVEVNATDAWNHNGGNAEYLLECESR